VQEPQSLDRSQGGLGLGLTIVRSLVTMHGGTVEAASEGAGRGSEFTVRLPPLGGDEAQPGLDPSLLERTPLLGSRDRRRRILVVDDNEDAAASLAEALEELGHTVEVAHDGPAALRKLEVFAPEVAFLDIGLPVMDGYELARRIREEPRRAAVRLVALTGYG